MSEHRNPTTITAQPGTPFIEIEREFEAPVERVFRAWTDPEILVNWLGPRELELKIIEHEARTGGRYRYVHRDTEGAEFGFHGVFHEVTEPRRVVQTFEFEGAPGNPCLESLSFEDLGGRTRVLTHSVYPSVQARDMALESGMEHGINDSMERLDEVLRDQLRSTRD
ncbi:SRPBCC family protein [Amycolatopsis aidingensis]|uniref:SRPBCC family protein n=1 Tax=Amycolatopsis aidingensis TaxID=2842453 RepID=UPI001C0AC19B|nr:SRPBCC family protein [Amycolatopsis aidingensis]